MSASINGVQLGPDSGAHWVFSSGVAPYELNLRMDAAAAQAVFDDYLVSPGEATLTIGSIEIKKLLILGTAPTDSPHESILTVVDGRWASPRNWFKKSYNVRRRTGTTRNVGGGGNIANLQQDADFQPWSLKDGKPWTGREVLEDVFEALYPASLTDGHEIRSGAADLPIVEDLELDGPVDVSIGRLFAALGGGMSLYVDKEGKRVVYDLHDETEAKLLGVRVGTRERSANGSSLPMVVGNPVFGFSDRILERPGGVYVGFSAAVELRFDAEETATTPPIASTLDKVVQDMRCQNVVAIPEEVTVRIGKNTTKTLGVGSWIPLTDYLDHLSGVARPSGLPVLSYDVINKAWLHAALEVYATLDPSGLWGRRIAAIRSSYRRTYRISRPYSESARQFLARRVQLQDVESDGYLAAPAYFDFAEWITWRGANAGLASAGPSAQETVKNRFANPAAAPNNIIGTPLGDLNEAPANISMIDPELGIFSVDFYPNIAARASSYLHSVLTTGTTPSGDPTNQDAIWLQDGELFAPREFSTVLSCVLEGPNTGLDSLHWENVWKDDVGGVIAKQKEGKAAAYEIHVDPGECMARFTWNDAKADEVKEFFAGSTAFSLVDVFGEPVNAAELRAVAILKAREIFSLYVDSYEGGVTTGLRDIEPTGAVKEVRHEASSSGILTSVTMPAGRPPLDLSQYLPASVRKLIDRGGEQ